MEATRHPGAGAWNRLPGLAGTACRRERHGVVFHNDIARRTARFLRERRPRRSAGPMNACPGRDGNGFLPTRDFRVESLVRQAHGHAVPPGGVENANNDPVRTQTA